MNKYYKKNIKTMYLHLEWQSQLEVKLILIHSRFFLSIRKKLAFDWFRQIAKRFETHNFQLFSVFKSNILKFYSKPHFKIKFNSVQKCSSDFNNIFFHRFLFMIFFFISTKNGLGEICQSLSSSLFIYQRSLLHL